MGDSLYIGVCVVNRVGKEMIKDVCCGGYFLMFVLSHGSFGGRVYGKKEKEYP